ncbi:TPA: hypothetical protein DF272_05690 [Candidatus Falkowbacteria bacterium]|nr:hypothetical protein [Candidatus Falkowbacteria bacterium]
MGAESRKRDLSRMPLRALVLEFMDISRRRNHLVAGMNEILQQLGEEVMRLDELCDDRTKALLCGLLVEMLEEHDYWSELLQELNERLVTVRPEEWGTTFSELERFQLHRIMSQPVRFDLPALRNLNFS